MPHSIRLHGPWEVVSSQKFRVRIPEEWNSFMAQRLISGPYQLCRRFNSPTGLTAHQSIYLVFESQAIRAEVFLNDQLLGPIDPTDAMTRFSITDKLGAHNIIRMDVNPASEPIRLDPESINPTSTSQFSVQIKGIRLEIETIDHLH